MLGSASTLPDSVETGYESETLARILRKCDAISGVLNASAQPRPGKIIADSDADSRRSHRCWQLDSQYLEFSVSVAEPILSSLHRLLLLQYRCHLDAALCVGDPYLALHSFPGWRHKWGSEPTACFFLTVMPTQCAVSSVKMVNSYQHRWSRRASSSVAGQSSTSRLLSEQLVLEVSRTLSFRVIMFKRSAKPTKEVWPLAPPQLKGVPQSESTEATPKTESPYRPYAETAPPT